jgi:hypothetical protein
VKQANYVLKESLQNSSLLASGRPKSVIGESSSLCGFETMGPPETHKVSL